MPELKIMKHSGVSRERRDEAGNVIRGAEPFTVVRLQYGRAYFNIGSEARHELLKKAYAVKGNLARVEKAIQWLRNEAPTFSSGTSDDTPSDF